MIKETLNEFGFLNIEELSSGDFQLVEVDPDAIVCKQSELFDGLKVIIEGECFVSCDPEQVREHYPDLLIDHRKPVVNLTSLKESLSKLIIPSLKDHDILNNISIEETPVYKSKYIRTLTKGDKIGDFELSLKLTTNIFTITNSSLILKVAHISLPVFQKLNKRNPQIFQNLSEIVFLKCSTYIKEESLTILFTNIQEKVKIFQLEKSDFRRPKSAMTDFEATLKLYERNSSALVPSYISQSMNMMWKTKLSEDYWSKKIQERKVAQEKESETRINFFRSSHHQSPRSRKALEKLKKDNKNATEPNQKTVSSSLYSTATLARIPINHPSVPSVWTILKAVSRFKHNPNRLRTNKIAKSKTHIEREQKRKFENSLLDDEEDFEDEETDQYDFDKETSDKNLSSIEHRMKNFLNSLPKTSRSDGVSPLKRYVVNGKSIPHLGGTVLVRLKSCNPLEDHEHTQHFILPKDALSTLQKYKASRLDGGKRELSFQKSSN